MAAVHVRVGHDDDLVVARLGDVEIISTDAGAQRRDDGADFSRAQHLVEARALNIQDLAAQRQDRLELAVARLLGGAAGRIALDQEQFAAGRVALLAVGQLAGQAGDVERALAPGQVARLARRLAGDRGFHHLADDALGLVRVLLEPLLQPLADHVLDRWADFGGDQLVLGLAGEFRIRHLHRQDAGQPLARILAAERHLLLLGDTALHGIGVDGAGQGRAQARQMRAAIALRDVVGEAQRGLVIGVGPLHRHLDRDALPFPDHMDRAGMQRRLGAVEIFHHLAQPALVMQDDLGRCLDGAGVGQFQMHAGIQEGQLAQPVFQRCEVEFAGGEGVQRGQEIHLGAAPAIGRPDFGQRRFRHAVDEADEIFLVIAPDRQLQPFRQRIHHGNTDAVQSAGDLVGILVELTAGMQLGHDDLGR